MAEDDQNTIRAREVADANRRYLVAVNTGGVGVTVAVASSLAGQSVKPAWAVWPLLFFLAGLSLIGVSLFFAKTRELRRLESTTVERARWEAVFKGEDRRLLDPRRYMWRSQAWEILSLVSFVAGSVAALIVLVSIKIPVCPQ